LPAKYVLHSKPIAPRVRPVGKLGIVDWREDCASCHNCVKRACIYGLYREESDTLHNELGYLDYIYQCKGCLSCVQNCTKNILTRVINPEFLRLGDAYYKPDMILSTWFQAESGRIPVSGSGYGGPFSGSGFDSMWTDMSEIVRPTRDGIHGREYISTSVDIGRKLPCLAFEDGRLSSSPPPLMEIPLPVLFDVIPAHWRRGAVLDAVTSAAAEIGTLAVVPAGDVQPGKAGNKNSIVPFFDSQITLSGERSSRLVMVSDGPDVLSVKDAMKKERGNPIVAIRVPASPAAAKRIVDLTRGGAEVVHLFFDAHGLEQNEKPRHARDVLREVHNTLVKEGIRDEITLIASGGIALAEHVAKAIICGADLVAIDVPLLLALDCRLCGECQRGGLCQIALEDMDLAYGVHRIVNLISAWHQQLLEVLGAMGIREVRRLRGETGRAMFFEDLEREAFGKLFGKRKNPGPIAA
jgi:ferredoxin